MAGVCDLAWVVLTDRVRAVAVADRQAVMTAALMAGCADRIALPSPEAAVAEWSAVLAAEPVVAADRELRDLLGVS